MERKCIFQKNSGNGVRPFCITSLNEEKNILNRVIDAGGLGVAIIRAGNERSQHKNKDQAMKMLKTKLYLLKQQQHLEKLSDIRGDVGDNGWGNQIRSYVLQPYTMVKDHRTNFESGNPSAVLDGDLDGFMNAYLAWDNNRKQEEN